MIECPTEDFLDSLLESGDFTKYQAEAKLKNDMAEVVVHFTPVKVMKHPKYQRWMSRYVYIQLGLGVVGFYTLRFATLHTFTLA